MKSLKVICVKPIVEISEVVKDCPYPKVGDINTVTEEYEEWGTWYYCLLGYPQNHIFKCDCFATLPNSTADEMREESREAIVNLETEVV